MLYDSSDNYAFEPMWKRARAMQPVLTAGVVLGVVFLQCNAQGTAKQPQKQAVSSPVQVFSGKSEMDGEHWVMLVVSAKASFQNVIGLSIRPRLEIACRQHGEEHTFSVVLESGPHETSSSADMMRMKLDNHDPQSEAWDQSSDHNAWAHRPPIRELTLEQIEQNYSGFDKDLVFLRSILAAKTVLIEFQPFMVKIGRAHV